MALERYSFSKCSCFEQCLYQYKLKYIDHVKDAGNAFSQYGGFVHELMESFENGKYELFELPGVYKSQYSSAVTLKFPPNAYVDLAESYYNDGLNFLNNFDGFDAFNILGVEKKFEFEVECREGEDFIFNGIIDLILERKSDGKLICWDWKSKSKFASKKERDKYARQPYLYSKYIKDTFGKYPDELWFGMFRKRKIEKIRFEQDSYEEAFAWLANTVGAIRSATEWPSTVDDFYCSALCGCHDECGEWILN